MLKSKGRMIRQEIRQSRKIASLCPESVALFCLLIPHFNAHGKMNGDPRFIKGEVCPLISWLTIPRITRCLAEISEKTNVKWFEFEGLRYLHSLNWTQHQELRADRKGGDMLPSYSVQYNSRSTPGLVPATPGVLPLEVEEEVEGKGKREVKLNGAPAANSRNTPVVLTTSPGLETSFAEIKTFPNHLLKLFRVRMDFINERDDRPRWVKIISDLCLYEPKILEAERAYVIQREGAEKPSTYYLETVRRRLVDKDHQYIKNSPASPRITKLIEDIFNKRGPVTV